MKLMTGIELVMIYIRQKAGLKRIYLMRNGGWSTVVMGCLMLIA